MLTPAAHAPLLDRRAVELQRRIEDPGKRRRVSALCFRHRDRDHRQLIAPLAAPSLIRNRRKVYGLIPLLDLKSRARIGDAERARFEFSEHHIVAQASFALAAVGNPYAHSPRVGPRVRYSQTLRMRYSVKIQRDEVVCNLDPMLLAQGPAIAIAQLLRTKIEAISAVASPATIRARVAAARAGRRDARYNSAPNQSNRLFNDSGRLASNITASPRGTGYSVTIAGNRLDGATLDNGGDAAVTRIWALLQQHIPELAHPATLLLAPAVEAGIRRATAAIFRIVRR